MENEEIISLNVREILEDVEQQLVKIGIYSKPVFETEDFGFYNKHSYLPIIHVGKTYQLIDIDGKESVEEYKGTLKSFNYFRSRKVKDLETRTWVYSPFDSSITTSRICNDQSLCLVNTVLDYVIKAHLPKRFGGMELNKLYSTVEEIIVDVFPLQYKALTQDGLERKDFGTNPLFVLVYNLFKLIESIIKTSKLKKLDVYVFTYVEGFIFLKSLGDFRIIEWEMLHSYACEAEESETGRACSEVDPVCVLAGVSDTYVEKIVEHQCVMEEKALAARLVL